MKTPIMAIEINTRVQISGGSKPYAHKCVTIARYAETLGEDGKLQFGGISYYDHPTYSSLRRVRRAQSALLKKYPVEVEA